MAGCGLMAPNAFNYWLFVWLFVILLTLQWTVGLAGPACAIRTRMSVVSTAPLPVECGRGLVRRSTATSCCSTVGRSVLGEIRGWVLWPGWGLSWIALRGCLITGLVNSG